MLQFKNLPDLTLKVPITTAADDNYKYFFIIFQRKYDLMFQVNPLPSISYYCQSIINQCQIITFLILKSDNIAKSRKDLKEILFPNKIKGT